MNTTIKFKNNSFRPLNAFCQSGCIASAVYNKNLPLEVIPLEGKFVIGTKKPDGLLFTRESANTFDTATEAEEAIKNGDFIQSLDYDESPAPNPNGGVA